jgi:hypothetical protein
MDNDKFIQIPGNVSTVADLLDTKSISWGEYQEHIPFPGFQGFNYSNQKTGANDYVRKHNPLVLFDSVVKNETRARQIKNFTDFETDLSNKKLPQWAFITPNMTNDAHDTNITFGAKWERSWMSSLLKDEYFMNNTLILLTFDEDDTYNKTNRVYRYVAINRSRWSRLWPSHRCYFCILIDFRTASWLVVLFPTASRVPRTTPSTPTTHPLPPSALTGVCPLSVV